MFAHVCLSEFLGLIRYLEFVNSPETVISSNFGLLCFISAVRNTFVRMNFQIIDALFLFWSQ